MKTLLTQLFQKLRAGVTALKNKISQLQQQVSVWFTQHWQVTERAVIVVIAIGVIGLVVLYLWRRSATFRVVVLSTTAGVLGLWGWLKGSISNLRVKTQPVEIRVPTLQSEKNADEKLPTW